MNVKLHTKLITLLLAVVVSLSSCSLDAKEQASSSRNTALPAATAASTPAPTEASLYTLSPDDIPAYTGEAVITLNNNVPGFTDSELTTEAFETYSNLDNLGRCGVAYANVCKELMPTEKRGVIGQVKPSGWHTIRYDFIDGMYLYNRCHLIAYQLAGENANEKKLITGTRYLNTQGMLPFENKTANYVEATGNHVLYRVTPVYVGDNPLALGVQMEAKSVEDDGEGLSFNVFCYNVQPGVSIDYATGDSWEDDLLDSQAPVVTEKPETAALEVQSANTSRGTTYVLNTNTKKFHYPSCSSVNDMKEKNKREFTGTRDEIIAQGYVPCKRCNP